MQHPHPSLSADIVTGALAGALGVWLMDRVGSYLYIREDRKAVRQEVKARVDHMDVAHVAANRLAKAAGTKLSPKQPHPAGLVIHYALGVVPAAFYGPLRHRVSGLRAGRGLLYGFGLFLVHDELLAPVLGLASGPTAYPWQAHVRGLISHLVLGVVTDVGMDAVALGREWRTRGRASRQLTR